jgi:hypothetical protein
MAGPSLVDCCSPIVEETLTSAQAAPQEGRATGLASRPAGR